MIDSEVLEQLIRVQVDAGFSRRNRCAWNGRPLRTNTVAMVTDPAQTGTDALPDAFGNRTRRHGGTAERLNGVKRKERHGHKEEL